MNESRLDQEICGIHAREILDSRGYPTIEVEVHTKSTYGVASVPAGASTGMHESVELRDGDQTRYQGKGVLKAIHNIHHIIAPNLIGKQVSDQRALDQLMIELDGTPNKCKLGANAILAVSLATVKTASLSCSLPLYRYLGGDEARVLPVPMMNVINGGVHAGNELSIQEFMILPIGAHNYSESLRMGVQVYHNLKRLLRAQYGPSAINLGDEGGYAPPLKETDEAIEVLLRAIRDAGFSPGKDIVLGLDCAGSEFFDPKEKLYFLDQNYYNAESLVDYYIKLVQRYPIFSIEDPFYEEDFESFSLLTREIGDRVQIVGDDLFVTNIKRLKEGIERGAANALLLKVNQIGSLSEALDAGRYAQQNNYNVIVSHRSGETTDDYIADIAVALNAGQIKTGAPARGERIAKYNRLLKIEAQLSVNMKYAGTDILRKNR